MQRVFATERAAREVWLGGVEMHTDDPWQIEERCGLAGPPGLCAEVGPYPYVDADSLLDAAGRARARARRGAGPAEPGRRRPGGRERRLRGLVLPERRSAEVTPAVCRASAGAVEHLPIAQVGNLATWLEQAKQREGLWVYGAEAGASVPYDQPDYSGRVILVLGSEGRGLRPRVAETCDQLVHLPVRGKVGSLNVATAASALVYGILHFRGETLDKAP